MSITKDTKPAKFVKHFGQIGSTIVRNPFIFHSLVEVTAKTPMTMTLMMEGERISRFKKSVRATSSGYILQ